MALKRKDNCNPNPHKTNADKHRRTVLLSTDIYIKKELK